MDGFIIIGTRNGLFYKDVFPLVQEGKITLGYTHRHIKSDSHFCFTTPNGDFFFNTPNGEIADLDHTAKWVTNMPVDIGYQLPLTETYTPEDYPVFDNYPDAINVDKLKDIPKDYYGVMGVPVGFVDKHNPNQFEIVGVINSPVLKGKNIYRRILIRRKEND